MSNLNQEKWFRPAIEPVMKKVCKEEFKSFLRNYPGKLEQDFYMDQYTFNDFDLSNRWPFTIVAKVICGMYGSPDEFEICENIFEVMGSVKYFDSEEDMLNTGLDKNTKTPDDSGAIEFVVVPSEDLLCDRLVF